MVLQCSLWGRRRSSRSHAVRSARKSHSSRKNHWSTPMTSSTPNATEQRPAKTASGAHEGRRAEGRPSVRSDRLRSPCRPRRSPRRASRSSEVVASKPRTSRALSTAGTRCATSCSKGGSDTHRNGLLALGSCVQMSSASSSTVVDSAVDRLKSSFRAAACSMAVTMPAGQVAAVGVVTHLGAVAEDVQRVLALEHLLDEVGTTWLMASFTLPLVTSTSPRARPLADADAVERAARSCTAAWYWSHAARAKYSTASFWKP